MKTSMNEGLHRHDILRKSVMTISPFATVMLRLKIVDRTFAHARVMH